MKRLTIVLSFAHGGAVLVAAAASRLCTSLICACSPLFWLTSLGTARSGRLTRAQLTKVPTTNHGATAGMRRLFVATVAALGLMAGSAMATTSPTAYVANYNSDTVTAISTTSDQVVATIPVGSEPFAVAATRTHAFIANVGSENLSVIDTKTDAVSATIPLDSIPNGVAAHGNRVYVTSNSDLEVISATTDRVIATVDTPGWALALNKGGTLLWDVDRYTDAALDGAVRVIATRTLRTIASIPTPAEYDPLGIALNRTRAYVVGDGGYMMVIDQATDQEAGTVAVGTSPWGIAATNKNVYVANRIVPGTEQGTISVINATSDQVTQTLESGNYPVGIALTPDHSKLFVAENANSNGPGACQVFSTATGALLDTIQVGNNPFSIGKFIN